MGSSWKSVPQKLAETPRFIKNGFTTSSSLAAVLFPGINIRVVAVFVIELEG